MGRIAVARPLLWLAFVALEALLVTSVLAPARAQDGAVVNPRRVVFEHDGKNVVGFALYLQPAQGAPLRLDLGSLKPDGSGSVTAPLPLLPPGTYTVEIAAYNASGESPRVAASPSRFDITAESSIQARETPPTAAALPEPPIPASVAGPPAPPADVAAPATPKKGSGFFGRFWKAVVGDDDK